MFRFAFDMVSMVASLARTAVRLAVLPLEIVLGLLFGRRVRRMKGTALLLGLGVAAGAVAATAAKQR